MGRVKSVAVFGAWIATSLACGARTSLDVVITRAASDDTDAGGLRDGGPESDGARSPSGNASSGNAGAIPGGLDAASCTIGDQCVPQCPGSARTTLQGRVYDPAGNNPLAGIAVFVPPTTPLPELPKGASCRSCDMGTPLAAAITQVDGTFTMLDLPAGPSVPVVVQVGKWRKTFRARVTPCIDNFVTEKWHLPRNSSDGPDASMPDIAVSTGASDSLECLLTRIGIDPAEFTSGASASGHVHIFQGGVGGGTVPGPQMEGGSPPSWQALWNTASNLQSYDAVLMSCEGAEPEGANPAALDAYLRNGGCVFASHFHYAWFTAQGSPLLGYKLGQFRAGENDTGDIDAVVDTSFAQGQALHDWLALGEVGALTNDRLPIKQSRQNVLSVNEPRVTSWIKSDSTVAAPAAPGLTQYFSFDAPVGGNPCGRLVYSDMHVGAASSDYANALSKSGSIATGVVPDQCDSSAKPSPQEAVLEYMLFNLASCPAHLAPPPNPSP